MNTAEAAVRHRNDVVPRLGRRRHRGDDRFDGGQEPRRHTRGDEVVNQLLFG